MGEMILTWEKQSNRRKTTPVPLCLPQIEELVLGLSPSVSGKRPGSPPFPSRNFVTVFSPLIWIPRQFNTFKLITTTSLYIPYIFTTHNRISIFLSQLSPPSAYTAGEQDLRLGMDHTQTHIWQDSSGRGIGPSQRRISVLRATVLLLKLLSTQESVARAVQR